MATASSNLTAPAAFTITGTSLGDMAAREGTLAAAQGTGYLDAILSGFIYSGAAVPTGNCYILLSSSDATTPSFPATGSDATIILPRIAWEQLESMQFGQVVPGTALVFAFKIAMAGMAAATKFGIPNISCSQAFGLGGLGLPYGGVAPVLLNGQGQAFDATAGHTVLNFTGVKQTIA